MERNCLGFKLVAEMVFDTSKNNPANPLKLIEPKIRHRFGEISRTPWRGNPPINATDEWTGTNAQTPKYLSNSQHHTAMHIIITNL